jgi:hypothetical protein
MLTAAIRILLMAIDPAFQLGGNTFMSQPYWPRAVMAARHLPATMRVCALYAFITREMAMRKRAA